MKKEIPSVRIPHQIVEFATDRLIPPIHLEKVENATIESAKEQDRNGDFIVSANHYYSVYETSNNSIGKSNALIGLAQQLINLGRFGQAKEILFHGSVDFSPVLSGRERSCFDARVEEKLGWIADYTGNFEESLKRFSNVNRIMRELSPETLEEKELGLTAIHFLGRATFGLASQGKDRERNLSKSIYFFSLSLLGYRNLEGDRTMEIGFCHAWLARTHLEKGEIEKAGECLDNMRESFEKYLTTNPERGIMAQYFLLKGVFEMKKGKIKDSQSDFEKSLEIRYEKERYPKGEAEALMGIAVCRWGQGKLGEAISYGLQAFKTYPLILIRPS